MRRGATRTKPGRKAKPPATRTSLKSDGARVRDLEKRLADAQKREAAALDQQAATSEILRVISSSPTEVQPVLDAIAERSARLCDAVYSAVFRVHGGILHFVAQSGFPASVLGEFRRTLPAPLDAYPLTQSALQERRINYVRDVRAEPGMNPDVLRRAELAGYRALLIVPMLREDEPVGVIAVTKSAPASFTDKQIALLQTFADQAVIAIENVRLFTELESRNRDLTHALDRQTATADVLRIIAQSPTELQPVLDAIATSAVRLCTASDAVIERLEGDRFYNAAHAGAQMKGLVGLPLPLTRRFPGGRAVLDRKRVIIDDIHRVAETEYPDTLELLKLNTIRSVAEIPLLSEGKPLGSLAVLRAEVRPFTDAEVALLETFASQAVIAIENVRLFTELQASNRELTTALDTQTATSDILRVISRSQTDVQPVFDAIVTSAVRLLQGYWGALTHLVGDQIELAAITSSTATEDPAAKAYFPRSVHIESAHSAAIRQRTPVNIADQQNDATVSEERRAIARARGYRSVVVVPLLRHGEAIGTIAVTRREAGGFADDEIALLQTFADQAVIAIENVRLFTELQARTAESEEKSRQLELASQHKSEFLANMSHELRTPLNAVIGFSEALTERMFGELNEKQAEYLTDIHASGQHLLSLINDILDLSKVEAGRMELELAEFDLPSAIDNALILVRERATRRGIALHQTIDERLGQVSADERKVKQVLLNLLSNAIKFTPEGGRIDVKAAMVDGAVEIAVTDTGIGIAPEDQQAVFEEFRQVGSADRKAEGTGLGLALARKFVELHGGRIWVQSQVGVGSTFTLTLPVRRGA